MGYRSFQAELLQQNKVPDRLGHMCVTFLLEGPNFLVPTVIANANENMLFSTEETFGLVKEICKCFLRNCHADQLHLYLNLQMRTKLLHEPTAVRNKNLKRYPEIVVFRLSRTSFVLFLSRYW